MILSYPRIQLETCVGCCGVGLVDAGGVMGKRMCVRVRLRLRVQSLEVEVVRAILIRTYLLYYYLEDFFLPGYGGSLLGPAVFVPETVKFGFLNTKKIAPVLKS